MLKINPQRSPGRIKRWENLYQGDIRRAPLRETLKKAKTEGESTSWAKRPNSNSATQSFHVSVAWN